MQLQKKAPKIFSMLTDTSVDTGTRTQLLRHICMESSDESGEILGSLLDAAAVTKAKSAYTKKTKELAALIQQMEQGPLRQATFLRTIEHGGAAGRARVIMEDGTTAFVQVPDPALTKTLRCGDTVLLEAQAKALLGSDPGVPDAGEEGRLERVLDDGRIEVSLREHERFVFRASSHLSEQIESNQVKPGRMLLVCPRQMIAFDSLPAVDDLTYYRFVERQPVPDVSVKRDIGSPPAYINELIEQVVMEMERPEIRRRYRLPRCATTLLCGVSGSGKTYSILALWRRLYEVMSEITGDPIDRLPPRVMRLRESQFLSKWLGDSDKNLDRFFDEVEKLAAEPFVASNGKTYELPVLAVLEEVDGLARARGGDAVYDRILTTALQRLDTSRQELRDKLILFVATTNVVHQVDPAFLRRIGGRVERFGRLNRAAFVSVLEKHLNDRPLAGANGGGPTEVESATRQLMAEVAAWLYGPKEKDGGIVELSFAGSTTPSIKRRQDFLTASLVDRAVREAAMEAGRHEASGGADPGLNATSVIAAIDQQIEAIIEQLHVDNVTNYVDLPDGVRVVNLVRIPQSSIRPRQYVRVA